MSIAAVPTYLGNDFKDASPGMRFGMYLTLWEGAAWSKTKDKPLDGAKRLGDNDKKTMQALIARQERCFDAVALSENTLRLEAQSIAPFTTGLGNEHPLENGFAFLNPYGLPYLPGSGVKDVLRQAARELASGDWGDRHGWIKEKRYVLMEGKGEKQRPILDKNKQPVMLSMADALFGLETDNGDTQHTRGALTFWDVIPQIKGDGLMVEIMTPHQKHYYQDGQSPHDSGQPTPISFLTVPPGSGFAFHVQCDLEHLTGACCRWPMEKADRSRVRVRLPMARLRRQDGGGVRGDEGGRQCPQSARGSRSETSGRGTARLAQRS
jgi:CRISPR-associated protein Cmr6